MTDKSEFIVSVNIIKNISRVTKNGYAKMQLPNGQNTLKNCVGGHKLRVC